MSRSESLKPENEQFTRHGKRDFTNVVEVKDLEKGRLFWVSQGSYLRCLPGVLPNSRVGTFIPQRGGVERWSLVGGAWVVGAEPLKGTSAFLS
jgi:hypothetical protein